jgi:regulation of enolase protein 1 (concanavalin A-like superfamily)
VMFRESLAANARHVMMIVSAGNGTALQYRTNTGSASGTSTPAAGGVPRWVRLVRSGNTFTGYASADGVNWTQAGTVTLAFPSAVYGGLVVTSHHDGVLATATFTNVSASGGSAPPPPPETTWSFGDIGAVGLAGSNSSSGNTITISGAGDDIWGRADAFRYVYRSLSGDGMVEARVTSVQNTHLWAKAGVMIRESLEPGARNAFALLTPSYHGVVAQARFATGGETTSSAGPIRNAPYWVRLTRTGTTFTAASSPDGVTWSNYATYTIAMGTTAYFGFAVTSHDAARLNTAVFEDPFVQ